MRRHTSLEAHLTAFGEGHRLTRPVAGTNLVAACGADSIEPIESGTRRPTGALMHVADMTAWCMDRELAHYLAEHRVDPRTLELGLWLGLGGRCDTPGWAA